jgi:hypothetical protein
MSEFTTGTGVVYQDLHPVGHPAAQSNTYDGPTTTSTTDAAQNLTDQPTASHALAQSAVADAGVAQLPHNAEVKDLGWNDPPSKIPAPLVGGLDNEELWVLVRRFNKVSTWAFLLVGLSDLTSTANVPCQGVSLSCARQPRSEHRRRR